MADLPLRIGYSQPRNFAQCQPVLPSNDPSASLYEQSVENLDDFRTGLGSMMFASTTMTKSNFLGAGAAGNKKSNYKSSGGGGHSTSSSTTASKSLLQRPATVDHQVTSASAANNKIDLESEIYSQLFAETASAFNSSRSNKMSNKTRGGATSSVRTASETAATKRPSTSAADGATETTKGKKKATINAPLPESTSSLTKDLSPSFKNTEPFRCDARITSRSTFDEYIKQSNEAKRLGISRKEVEIEQKLRKKLTYIQKQQRFDSLVKSDGTFKRQVWASMIKEGLIGYNKTSKKAQAEMGARDAQSFLQLLVRRFGTIMRAWRNGLDLDGNGRISYYEFCKAARAIGYESSLRQLWNDLNDNDDKAFITLDELDVDTFNRINYFNDILTRNFSSLKEAWLFFDIDKQNQIYEKQFRIALVDKLNFDTAKYDLKKLYEDLDYDGNGFLTLDDWLFLKKWVTSNDCKMLEEFRKVLRSKYFKPTDAFYKVFDVNRNGSIDPLEFVEGCNKLKLEKHITEIAINPRRLFELLDADESGEISVSEFIKLFTATESSENKVTAVDEHNPLPAIQKEIQSKFGCIVDLEELQQPLKKSYQLYDAVFRRLEETERTDLHELINYQWTGPDESLMSRKSRSNNLFAADGTNKPTGENKEHVRKIYSADSIQDIADLDLLLQQAELAQAFLKRALLKEEVLKENGIMTTVSTTSGAASRSSTKTSSSPADDPSKNFDAQEFKKKIDQIWPSKTTTKSSSLLKHPFQEAFDPAIKSKKRCIEKANYKYEATYGKANKFRRIRDVARISLHFNKCRELLSALKQLDEFYNVISIDNRMKYPTALGWRDFAALVMIELPSENQKSPEMKKHVCEIQLQLTPFNVARKQAHQYYRTLREKIPSLVQSKQADALQEAILDSLQAVRKSEFCSHVTVGVDMDRSKVWTQPWYQNPLVLEGRVGSRREKMKNQKALQDPEKSANNSPLLKNQFPKSRPELPIVSMRTDWMRGNMHGSFPPPVPDLRDNRPWLPAGGLLNGLFTNLTANHEMEDYVTEGERNKMVEKLGNSPPGNKLSGGKKGGNEVPVGEANFDERVKMLEKSRKNHEKRKREYLQSR
ncbi:unnamed protein product [Amoebophrya sp. A120]|nr:unnamed protein product [Amoebophrya sp. A120]|eukprot:GSA120T00014066001.1